MNLYHMINCRELNNDDDNDVFECEEQTEKSCHERDGELWCEQGEEPGCGIQGGRDVVTLEVMIQTPVLVV